MVPRSLLFTFALAAAGFIQALPAFADAGSAYAVNTADDTLSAADRRFVVEAGAMGHAEVAMGSLAQSRSGNAKIRQFAQRIAAEHARTDQALAQVKRRLFVAAPAAITPREKAVRDRLAGLSGARFDRVYINEQLRDIRDSVRLYQMEVEGGRSVSVRNFAAAALPGLKDQLVLTVSIARSLDIPLFG